MKPDHFVTHKKRTMEAAGRFTASALPRRNHKRLFRQAAQIGEKGITMQDKLAYGFLKTKKNLATHQDHFYREIDDALYEELIECLVLATCLTILRKKSSKMQRTSCQKKHVGYRDR
jgi:hypothetical protein